MAFKMLIILIFFLISTPCYGANWYVDNAATGTNAGTSWTNAWQSFADVTWGVGGVVAGDTLYISGGTTSKTYTENFTVGASGSAGNPITIRVGQDAGHTGTVIFDYSAQGDTAAINGITISGSYITVNGAVGTASRLTMKNLYNTGDRTTSYGFISSGKTNIIITYVTFDNMNNPIKLATGTALEVSYCTMTNVRGDGAIGFLVSTGAADTNLIHHNSISLAHNAATGGPDGIQAGSGTSIYNNAVRVDPVEYATSNQHTDFVQAAQGAAADLANMKIYNNDFCNIGDSGLDFDQSQSRSIDSISIYNNTFRIETAIDPYPEYIRFYKIAGTVSNVLIANNTFIDNTEYTNIRFTQNAAGSGVVTGVQVKNNLFYNVSKAGVYIFHINGSAWDAGEFSFANNIYYASASEGNYLIDTAYTIANWISASTGIDRTGSSGQPTFVSYSANSASNNLRLPASDTVAINNGADLSATFTTDKDGNTRVGTFDIGAYEFIPTQAAELGSGVTWQIGSGVTMQLR